MPQNKSVLIKPARNILGSLRVPGDKSISHRYAMLAALAPGRSRFDNFAPGADCASTLGCVRALGCNVERDEKGTVVIDGLGTQLRVPAAPLDCGNSGSTMRMLSGILAAQPFSSELIGDESLSRRPMKRVIEPLTQMGADIHATNGDRAPLRMNGAKLHGIDYAPPVASAQVKTSVLFAGLLAEGKTTVAEPARTRDHGELALRAFGAEVERTQNAVSIFGGQALHPLEAFVPGDISSAAFFLCAATIFPESNLVIDGVLLNPTRSALLDVLAAMGSRISMVRVEESHGELVGTITLAPGQGRHVKIEKSLTADRRASCACGDRPVHGGRTGGSRCGRAACEGIRPAECGHSQSSGDGRASGADRRWLAHSRRPAPARRRDRKLRRSPHRYGIRRRSAAGRRRDAYPQRRVCCHFLSQFL